MKIKKYSYFFACVFLLLGGGLQGCNATTGDILQNSHSKNIGKKTVSELFNNGISVYLHDIIQGYKMDVTKDDKIIKRPLTVSRVPFLRKVILNSKRGKRVSDCQFIAIRVETDGKVETAEWLVTTDNQGGCKTKKLSAPRDYWLIQQKEGAESRIILSSKGTLIQINGHISSKDSPWNTIDTRSTATIKGTFIACYNEYAMQNGHYQLINKRVEADKPTGYMYDSYNPEMIWEPVDDPEYQCPSSGLRIISLKYL